MREIPPSGYATCEDYLKNNEPLILNIIEKIRLQKISGLRLKPSNSLIDRSNILTSNFRLCLLDKIALLVDEHLFGRDQMNIQFAQLLDKSLKLMGFDSKIIKGQVTFFDINQRPIYSWLHSWTIVNDELIDGNIDSSCDNFLVPDSICAKTFWGHVSEIPSDRKYQENTTDFKPAYDNVVEDIWWPELKSWIDDYKSINRL